MAWLIGAKDYEWSEILPTIAESSDQLRSRRSCTGRASTARDNPMVIRADRYRWYLPIDSCYCYTSHQSSAFVGRPSRQLTDRLRLLCVLC